MTGYFWENCLLAEGLDTLPFVARQDLATLGGDDESFPQTFLTRELEKLERRYGKVSAEFRLALFTAVLRLWPTVSSGLARSMEAVTSVKGEATDTRLLLEKRADLLRFFWERCANASEDMLDVVKIEMALRLVTPKAAIRSQQ